MQVVPSQLCHCYASKTRTKKCVFFFMKLGLYIMLCRYADITFQVKKDLIKCYIF